MDNNSMLPVKKEGIFSRIISFIKRIYNHKEDKTIEKTEGGNLKSSKNSDFWNDLIIKKQEDPELLKLQKEIENNEVNMLSISDEEIDKLNLLYEKQIIELEKTLDNKKTELNMMKFRVKSV